jgi:dephospho-CoA kinase
MILKAGLTGGMASGKSTIARHFANLGCYVIDADAVVSRLYRPGEQGYTALVSTYGQEILRRDGEIDRPKLAATAFASEGGAKRLNALIHPLVIEEQQRMIAGEESRFPGRDRIAMVEATLLIESGGRQRFDKIVVVDVDPETQIARAVARGMDRDDAIRRIAHQLPRQERLRHADYVIDNNGSQRDAEVATHRVYASLQRDLEAKKTPSRQGEG